MSCPTQQEWSDLKLDARKILITPRWSDLHLHPISNLDDLQIARLVQISIEREKRNQQEDFSEEEDEEEVEDLNQAVSIQIVTSSHLIAIFNRWLMNNQKMKTPLKGVIFINILYVLNFFKYLFVTRTSSSSANILLIHLQSSLTFILIRLPRLRDFAIQLFLFFLMLRNKINKYKWNLRSFFCAFNWVDVELLFWVQLLFI